MVADLEPGRTAFRAAAWDEAYALLGRAAETTELDPADQEILAECAHLLGHTEHSIELRSRLYAQHVQGGAHREAALCAYRIHLVLSLRGDMAAAMGWLARAQRLLAAEPECAAHGYVCLAEAEANYFAGNLDVSLELGRRVTAIGERHGDRDLVDYGLHQQGRALAALGDIAPALALLDEAMLAVVSGEVRSPLISAGIYCSSINVCEALSDIARAQAWTSAFEHWACSHPAGTPISGSCRMHRSVILWLHGSWIEAEREARLACQEQNGTVAMDAGRAWYQVGEIRRVVGDFTAAEEAFAHAGRYGSEVQPGMALLRAAQGRTDAAMAGLARALAERPADRLARAKLLPAMAELSTSAGEYAQAQQVVAELDALADIGPAVRACAAYARGALHVVDDDPAAALPVLRTAARIWSELDMPYELARTRRQIRTACRSVGDEEAAAVEWDSCRSIFARLGAVPDVVATDGLLADRRTSPLPAGLTAREAEVLRLVSGGLTNHAIAQSLSLSDKTVARHLGNIFTKIGVSSRAAATAYAYRHDLA
ncbi:helix-turn-helix transcriptional regulator [Nocardia cyriacigeorgica]|uniref:helix-turn-helix transcriptional regulator n=1 Tax=Nocardia cyriacigeorgica TaxID=135487 RepID=UPI002453928D|nr:helix-turn-helix transcriptional regulator [Nocardia cyriacigeorgica]